MINDVKFSSFEPTKFSSLLGSALPVPEKWQWMREPWSPEGETDSAPDASSAPIARPTNDVIATDALPDPVQDGQRFAQAGGRPPPRRGGGLPETPLETIRSANFASHIRALAEIEPNNKELTRISPPGWRPTDQDVAKIHQELLMARQRAAGAIDTQASGIGIGPFARESIPARSENRDFTDAERAEINRLGAIYGCHTCGTRDPGSSSGNFILDHQRATRLNEPGELQRIFPHCATCSARQGGLISGAVKRENP